MVGPVARGRRDEVERWGSCWWCRRGNVVRCWRIGRSNCGGLLEGGKGATQPRLPSVFCVEFAFWNLEFWLCRMLCNRKPGHRVLVMEASVVHG